MDLTSATVNDSTFAMPASTTAQSNTTPMYLDISKGSSYDSGTADETLSSAQGDTGGVFRQVDGKYIYNLDVSSLQGPGTYQLAIDPTHVGGSDPQGTVQFVLK